MELYVLYKEGQPVIVTSQGKKQPKVYLSEKNAKNAVSNMKDQIDIITFIPKGGR